MMRDMTIDATGSEGTVLLTLGRLPVALDLARGFDRLGWRVVVAEPFGMHLCRMSRSVHASRRVRSPRLGRSAYLEDLLAVIADENVSLVVPVSEESIHVAALRDRLPPQVSLFSSGQEELLKLHDKLEFNRQARALGLDVPKTWVSPDALEAEPEDLTVVVKRRWSCSGTGLRFATAGSLGHVTGDELVQERVDGDERSYFAIARNGDVLSEATYRARVRSGSVAVCFERVADAEAVEAWARTFVRASGHSGFIGFDFMIGEGGKPFAIECNPRATSGLHFLDAKVAAKLIAGAGGETLARDERPRYLTESWSCYTSFLAALLRGQGAGRIFSELRRASDVTWARTDPWPFLLMTVNTWPVIRRALSARRGFAQVAMLDLEWRADGN